MEESIAHSLLKMDIFFFITTVLLVVVGVLVAVLLAYLIRTVRSVLRIVERVEQEVSEIATDVCAARRYLTQKVVGAKDAAESGIGVLRRYATLLATAGLERVVAHVMKSVEGSAAPKKAAKKKRAAKKESDTA
jgi:hypothetical protein